MSATTDLTLPSSGLRPDIWYFLAAAQSTTYFPLTDSYRRLFLAAGPCQVRQIRNQFLPGVDPDTDDDQFLPVVHIAIYDEWILVAIQGARSRQQVIDITRYELQAANPAGPGKLSLLFRQQADALHALIANEITTLTATRKIVVVGHSMGGMFATALAPLMLRDFPGSFSRSVVIGSPKVGNPEYATSLRQHVVNLQNEDDPACLFPPGVTTLVPFGPLPVTFATLKHWEHAGVIYTLDLFGGLKLIHRSFGNIEASNSVSLISIDGFRDIFLQRPHRIEVYLQRMRSHLPANPKQLNRTFGWKDFSIIDEVVREMAAAEGLTFVIN